MRLKGRQRGQKSTTSGKRKEETQEKKRHKTLATRKKKRRNEEEKKGQQERGHGRAHIPGTQIAGADGSEKRDTREYHLSG